MKTTLKYTILMLIAGTILTVTSCKKTFYTNANKNPNSPTKPTAATLLSPVEVAIGYTQGGDYSRFASMFTQQTQGVGRQSAAYYEYIFTAQDVDDLWGNLYTSIMENDYSLLQLAKQQGDNEYVGIGQILMGYALQLTVDGWGNAPYSQALQGATNLHPAYDKDVTLYASINALIDSGIARLNNPNTGIYTPSSDDFIYGGNAAEWIKFGHAIKARLFIHQSNNNNTMADSALAELNESFGANTDNAQLIFGSTQTNSGPWYQYDQQRGDISFNSSTLADTMLAHNDPRFNIYFDTSLIYYQGVPIGYADVNEVGMGPYYGNANSPVEFICYDELQFMAAEANVRIGNMAAAQTAFTNALTANLQKLGVAQSDITSYLTAHGTLSGSTALAQVATEEWIALYLNPEEWTTYRRIGIPVLVPPPGAAISQVPLRFYYPQTELTYNAANVPSGATQLAPIIFWESGNTNF